ncbi:hypothetical protein MATL_G00101070 [Megalops atlanticus]|uniref:Uncharacterized protein n=1 Tax=Megalops atlanticus TaxID=7932 RepID=A0A9D3TDI0_MEGAT|nr:hypothetical protein MATL_G00101070 [Megalops atlanticus]
MARNRYPSHPLTLQGVNRGAPYQQYQPVVMLQQAYSVQWHGGTPEEVILYPINFNRGDWIQLALCYPRGTMFKIVSDIYQRESGRVQGVAQYDPAATLAILQENLDRKLYHYDNETGYLLLHLQAHHLRQGHSYCSEQGCERVKILASTSPLAPGICQPRPLPEHESDRDPPRRLWAPQRLATPCPQCGAPQVAVSSSPHQQYVRVQVLSLSSANIQQGLKSAFIKVNEEVLLFGTRGLFFVVLDPCTGELRDRRHLETFSASVHQVTSSVDSYIISAIKERSIVLVCSRDVADLPRDSKFSSFIKLGSVKPIALNRKGSLAFLGYRGLPVPPWVTTVTRLSGDELATLQHYVPLGLGVYGCSGQGLGPQRAGVLQGDLLTPGA